MRERERICTLDISIEDTNKYHLSYKTFDHYIQIGNCKKVKKINNTRTNLSYVKVAFSETNKMS